MNRTEAQKKNLSTKMKAKWAMCEEIGILLNTPKENIFAKYDILEGYFPSIRRKNPDVIAHVLKLLNSNKSESNYVQRMVIQEAKEKKDKEIKSNDNVKAMEDLKIMFWVINKIGSIEKAKKLFQAAILAFESVGE